MYCHFSVFSSTAYRASDSLLVNLAGGFARSVSSTYQTAMVASPLR